MTRDAKHENPAFLQEQIITYIGNKRLLLAHIGQAVAMVKKRLGKKRLSCLDLFSGSGVVARYFKQHAEFLVANDLEPFCSVINHCYLANNEVVDRLRLRQHYAALERQLAAGPRPGFISELYAPANDQRILPGERVFYTRQNALFLDSARQAIATLPDEVQPFFLAPLLAAASIHTNTAGIFKGFYKNADGTGQFGGRRHSALGRIIKNMTLQFPLFSNFCNDYCVTRLDATTFFPCPQLPEFDLAYLDPPYNQHPYGSNYFMLNLLCDYRRPQSFSAISGIPDNWQRSPFNLRRRAKGALFALIRSCQAKFILLSYNSEGFIPHRDFLAEIRRHGRVTLLKIPYNTYRGSRNLRQRAIHVTEFLYLVEKQ